MTALYELTIAEARALLDRREISAVELTQAHLDRIAAVEPKVNSFLSLDGDAALAQAKAADEGPATGSPLQGIPLAIKDVISTKGVTTTCASKMLENYKPPYNATVMERLEQAGAVMLGKTNCDEFAMGSSTENSAYAVTRNPWDTSRVPGGSSGGSASAVAACEALGSLGSDTRGSIRIPAACCGITGFKPTYGTISTEGTFPLAASLDHLGPLTRSVEDAALMYGVMTGTPAKTEKLMATVRRKPGKFRLAISEFFFRGVDREIVTAIEAAVKELERLGASIVTADIPELEESLEASRVIGLAESIGYHDELLKKNRDGYGPLVRARLEGGYQLTALQLVRAEERRLELIAAYDRLFAEVDFLVGAVLPVLPPKQSELTIRLWGRGEVTLAEAFCHFNAPQNLTGCPALALPIAPSRSGLPMSLQLVAGYGEDARLLQLGAAFQRATDWHLRRPTT